MEMNKIWEIAQEAQKEVGTNHETLVFTDGNISNVCGSWEANKPVWVVLQGEYTAEEIAASLIESMEDGNGCPCNPTGIAGFKKANPDVFDKINGYFGY